MDKLLAQTDANLAKGFRAIKIKADRRDLFEDMERVGAMRAHLGRGLQPAYNEPRGARRDGPPALAACSNRSYLEAHGFGLDAYIAHPLEVRNGLAVAPNRPGHGIDFDWQKLATIVA